MDPANLAAITHQQQDRIQAEREFWNATRQRIIDRRRTAAARAQALAEAKHETLAQSLEDDAWRLERVMNEHESRRRQQMLENHKQLQHASELVSAVKAQREEWQNTVYSSSIDKVERASELHSAAVTLRAVSAGTRRRETQQRAAENRRWFEDQRERKRLQLRAQEEARQREALLRDSVLASRAQHAASHLETAHRVAEAGKMQLENRRLTLEEKLHNEQLRLQSVAEAKRRELEHKKQEKREHFARIQAQVRETERLKQMRAEQIARHFDATLALGEMRREHNAHSPQLASSRYFGGGVV